MRQPWGLNFYTIFKKCDVITSSWGLEGCILKTNLELLHTFPMQLILMNSWARCVFTNLFLDALYFLNWNSCTIYQHNDLACAIISQSCFWYMIMSISPCSTFGWFVGCVKTYGWSVRCIKTYAQTFKILCWMFLCSLFLFQCSSPIQQSTLRQWLLRPLRSSWLTKACWQWGMICLWGWWVMIFISHICVNIVLCSALFVNWHCRHA